jgi:hypothetical protein
MNLTNSLERVAVSRSFTSKNPTDQIYQPSEILDISSDEGGL